MMAYVHMKTYSSNLPDYLAMICDMDVPYCINYQKSPNKTAFIFGAWGPGARFAGDCDTCSLHPYFFLAEIGKNAPTRLLRY